MDIEAYLRALEAGIGLLPAAMIVVALLGGPTAAWLLYRFFIQPNSGRDRASPMGTIWICTGCRSANELTASRCYRCHRKWDEAPIGFLDLDSGHMVDVPPSAIAPAPMPIPQMAEPRPGIAPDRRGPVPVGPGKLDVARPRRAVGPGRAVATGRSAPTGRSARTGRGTPKGSKPRPRPEG